MLERVMNIPYVLNMSVFKYVMITRLTRVLKIPIWQVSGYTSSYEMVRLQRVLHKLYSRDSRYSEYNSGSQYTKSLNVLIWS